MDCNVPKNLQSPISNLQSPISNLQSPISNLQSPISNLQSPISNLQSPISNLQSPISNLQSPICYKSAFTLIELSLVLVIIGLIVGGVLAGQDLIRAAQLRSIAKNIDEYRTAVNAFKLKYNCLPGDCSNATDFFGAENANPATCITIASQGSLTCNGDGDGQVRDCNVASDGTVAGQAQGYEMYRFWQHLAIAGMIKGKYTGKNGGSICEVVRDTNSPSTAIDNVGFSVGYLNLASNYSENVFYAMNYGNAFYLGSLQTGWRYGTAFLTPAEAMAFDQKLDDGMPASGFMIASNNAQVEIGYNSYQFGTANSCVISTSQYDLTGAYKVSHSTKSCSFIIKTGF